MSVCRRRHFRRTSDMRQELLYMYGVTPPINNMHYRSTLHTHLAAVLQTGRPRSTAWESRDTQMSPDLTSCSSLGYTKECAAVGTLAGVEFRRLVTLSSASGLCAALSRTRQSQNRNRSELKDCLHSLIRRSPQTIGGKEIGVAFDNRDLENRPALGACHGSGMPRTRPLVTTHISQHCDYTTDK
jgi:hypothetical protein